MTEALRLLAERCVEYAPRADDCGRLASDVLSFLDGIGSSIDPKEVARMIEPRAWAALGKENDSTTHRDSRVRSLEEAEGDWITLDCERALYVDGGRSAILCDRLPHPVTLVVKLAPEPLKSKGTNHDR